MLFGYHYNLVCEFSSATHLHWPSFEWHPKTRTRAHEHTEENFAFVGYAVIGQVGSVVKPSGILLLHEHLQPGSDRNNRPHNVW
eukprot:COSAG02_NODE_1449_length_12567_cov_4.622474_8_plen_84_part_00